MKMFFAFHAVFVKTLSQHARDLPHALRRASRQRAAPARIDEKSADDSGFSMAPSGATPLLAACIETLFLGGAVPASLLWFAGARLPDVVLPALALPALLLGLRYGYFAGAASAMLCAAVLAAVACLRPDALHEFPKAPFIVVLLAGITAGEFRDLWAGRMRRLDYLCRYHRMRLEQFTASHQLLQASHARLERQLAHGAGSLRTMLQRLQRPPVAAPGDTAFGGIGQWLLDVMAEAGNLHIAAVYEVNERGIVQLPAVATFGQAPQLSLFNPLLREALRTGELTAVHGAAETAHTDVIAVAPLVDAARHIHGVVSIHALPFIDLHQHTFDLLGVLGRHIGDILASRARPFLEPAYAAGGFRDSLQSHLTDAGRYGLPTALLVCKILDTARRDTLITLFCHSGRSLDQAWTSCDRQNQPVIVKLFPLTDESGVARYLERLDSECGGAVANGICHYARTLDKGRNADQVIAEICNGFDIDAQQAMRTRHKDQCYPEAKP